MYSQVLLRLCAPGVCSCTLQVPPKKNVQQEVNKRLTLEVFAKVLDANLSCRLAPEVLESEHFEVETLL